MQHLRDIPKEQILPAIIQTAHDISPQFAMQISEKLDVGVSRYTALKQVKSLNISRAPHKYIVNYHDSPFDANLLASAAVDMLKALVTGRGVVHSTNVMESALRSLSFIDFDEAIKVTHWVAESLLRRTTTSAQELRPIMESVILAAALLFELGNRLAFLSEVPEGVRQGFQGLSSRIKTFRVGERDIAVQWVQTWLSENAREYVKICDSYFDLEQLWLLQSIPLDVKVTLATTSAKLSENFNTESEEDLKRGFLHAWRLRSDQDPPMTLVIVQKPSPNDAYHDRFIVTRDAGLHVGTSFNGFGNKDFTITILTPEDARAADENYVSIRTNIQQNFATMTFFRMGH